MIKTFSSLYIGPAYFDLNNFSSQYNIPTIADYVQI